MVLLERGDFLPALHELQRCWQTVPAREHKPPAAVLIVASKQPPFYYPSQFYELTGFSWVVLLLALLGSLMQLWSEGN